MRTYAFLLATVIALGLMAGGCGSKSSRIEPRDTEDSKSVTSQLTPHLTPTIDQLSVDLKALQDLYEQLEWAYKSSMDETSWRQWSAQWNHERQLLFNKMEITYDPAQGQTDIIAQGDTLIGAAAALSILWQEYTNYITGSQADPDYFRSEFMNYTSQVKDFLEQHK